MVSRNLHATLTRGQRLEETTAVQDAPKHDKLAIGATSNPVLVSTIDAYVHHTRR